MKILKPGKHPGIREWTGEFECTGAGNGNGGCGALLLVSKSDLYTAQSSALHEVSHYVMFMCPQCGEETDLWRNDGGKTHPNFTLRPSGRRDLGSRSETGVKRSRERIRAGLPFVPPHQKPKPEESSVLRDPKDPGTLVYGIFRRRRDGGNPSLSKTVFPGATIADGPSVFLYATPEDAEASRALVVKEYGDYYDVRPLLIYHALEV